MRARGACRDGPRRPGHLRSPLRWIDIASVGIRGVPTDREAAVIAALIRGRHASGRTASWLRSSTPLRSSDAGAQGRAHPGRHPGFVDRVRGPTWACALGQCPAGRQARSRQRSPSRCATTAASPRQLGSARPDHAIHLGIRGGPDPRPKGLNDGCVRDAALTQLDAAAQQDQRALGAGHLRELRHEARLTNPGLARDQCRRAVPLSRPPERPHQPLELGGPTDERRAGDPHAQDRSRWVYRWSRPASHGHRTCERVCDHEHPAPGWSLPAAPARVDPVGGLVA